MSENPLSKYYRQPAIYVKLPSEGKYWKPDALNMEPNGELPVLPMSGRDDLLMRTADGLMNGATTVKVIESCFPNIKNAWDAPSIDIDTLLISTRIATYGNTVPFETKCAKCNEDMSYEADLSVIKDSITLPDYSKSLNINDLMVWFRPNTYKEMNEANQETFLQQRTIAALQNSALTEDEKVSKFKESLAELTANTVAKVAGFIDYIITPDGQKVVDHEQISEFVMNADQKTFTALSTKISELAQAYQMAPIKIKCSHCGHEDTRQFQFDPSNFFA